MALHYSIASAVAAAALIAVSGSTAANAAPTPVDNLADVPARTSLTFQHTPTGVRIGTPNAGEVRPGLSTVKLFIADQALRHGDGSAQDRYLAERMIRYSDDGAASQLYSKYPASIDAAAGEYRLTGTSGAPDWGTALTTTADTVTFLEVKKSDPGSPILGWMASSERVAADGTVQDWGTAHLPGAVGSKWGWSDFGAPNVASASFGPDFSVAAHTYGTAADQTADVTTAFGPDVGPVPPPSIIDDLLQRGRDWLAIHGIR